MRRITLILTALFMVPALLGAGDEDPWKKWRQEIRRGCPANHLEWIADGDHDELLANFSKTLHAATQRRIDAIADYALRCSHEQIGFYCEMAVHLDAFNRLGLLRRFAGFACQHYKCTEPAFCTKDGR
jgi:hypothetical protein